MCAQITEYLEQQLAGAVDDSGLVGEIRRRSHEADDLHDTRNGWQADQSMHGRQRVQCANPRLMGGNFRHDVGANLASHRQFSVDERKLPGRVDEGSAPYRWLIRRRRGRHRWQLKAELGEPIERRVRGQNHDSTLGRIPQSSLVASGGDPWAATAGWRGERRTTSYAERMATVARAAVPPTVAGIPAAARLHVVTGKGGTGKTTVAAALAMALSVGGRRTLVVEVEGRQGLAQLFDVPALSYKESRLATTEGGGEVLGLSVDAEQALLEYLDMFYSLKRSARALRRMGAIDFVTTLAPGLRDILITGKLKEAVVRTRDGRPQYDAVVLDAPPTGRIRLFLDSTKEVVKLTKFGPIHRQSTGVIKLLHSSQTAVHIVTLLEEMPVQETIDAAHDLAAADYRLGAVVVNRMRPALVQREQVAGDGGVDVASLKAGLKMAGVATALADPLAREMSEYAAWQREQADIADRLDSITAPRITLPDLAPPVDLGELTELAGYFLAGDVQ